MNEDGWFNVQDITPENGQGKVYMISEHAAATCYLVTGSRYAMLIDTGIGVLVSLAINRIWPSPLEAREEAEELEEEALTVTDRVLG